jgi:surface protein
MTIHTTNGNTCPVCESGNAYAVLTDEGDLIFFRSREAYSSDTRTMTDLRGNIHSGKIYCGIEDFYGSNDPASVPWHSERYTIKKVFVAPDQIIQPNSTRYWFQDCKNMISFNETGFDTSKVTDMCGMFFGCSSLESLTLNHFDTSAVKNMSRMFRYCFSHSSLELNDFDT